MTEICNYLVKKAKKKLGSHLSARYGCFLRNPVWEEYCFSFHLLKGGIFSLGAEQLRLTRRIYCLTSNTNLLHGLLVSLTVGQMQYVVYFFPLQGSPCEEAVIAIG